MSAGQVVSINVGGAGVRIGAAVTRQYMLENGIDLDGTLMKGDTPNPETFFEESSRGKYTSRQISVDLDSSSLDSLEDGSLAKVLHPNFLLRGREDAANNFARGHYSVGKGIMDQVTDRIRKMSDACDKVQGFIVNHSLGGGTGSGLGSLILERIAVDYRRTSKLGVEVLGNGTSCQTYNETLAMHKLLDLTNVSLVFDNRKVRQILDDSKLPLNKIQGDGGAAYEHVNSVIARINASVMQPATSTFDIHKMELDLVPFPRLHFMTTSLTFQPPKQVATTKDLMQAAVESKYMTMRYDDFDAIEDKYMGMSLYCRGAKTKEVDTTAKWLESRNKVSFVDLCPTKTQVDTLESDLIEKSVTMLGNNLAINREFARNSKRFDKLYSQKAYVHLYVAEGMEEAELAEAREDLGFLEKDYLDVIVEQATDEDDDDDFR